jgi:hypothetical protein
VPFDRLVGTGGFLSVVLRGDLTNSQLPGESTGMQSTRVMGGDMDARKAALARLRGVLLAGTG